MKLVLATAALALAAGAATAQDVIRMGTEGAYPPYNFIDDSGEVAGFERELGDELCARAGLTCEWVTTDWDSIIPNLVSGNYDTIIAGMSITDEREEVIDFTQDYYPPTESAYVAASEEVDVLSGVVSAQTATIQAGHVAESGAALLEFATPEETVAAVRDGEADAVFADYDYLLPLVEASGGELMFVGERVPLGGGVGMGLRESDAALRDQFDAAITSMKEDGTLNALLVEWFGEQVGTY
ncbi:transporter substrate-binding domain-containing protein [Wenxinia saemankumensis]|uniref:Amino acid ABC transporter substrate-binding protein, PAAT family n=1 Tax=Wenxinia saemankumensis TaxID=1447782 RepID=A0A1M6CGH7_9RHOB|nr:transporter substrate-binding domain-containing protein [Wenxinia saemankumensis]SHI59951.1 amino acid ABC transporter substrate-binding protein, PAAT family [Wenxinia saemankumensis]